MRSFLVLIADDYERKKALDGLLSRLPSFVERGFQLELLQSPSLFGEEPVLLIDEADKLEKAQQQAIVSFLKKPLDFGYLVLGARSKVPFTAERIIDLLGEKPWEKQRRLTEALSLRVESAGKRLASDVLPLLFERTGIDGALLDQEIDKLLCFIGERLTIERADVFRLIGEHREETPWQLVDELVWEGGYPASGGEQFYALMPLIRSQLQLGLKLAGLIEAKIPSSEWAKHVPKMWPKTLEKRGAQAGQKGPAWFRKGLDLLFHVELLSRDGSSHKEALFDLFAAGLK